MAKSNSVIGLAAALLLGCTAGLAAASDLSSDAEQLSAGRRLYLDGQRSGGLPLIATRPGGLAIAGGEAACVNCHRRSGFGGSEGRSYIPAVTAAALFSASLPGTGASAGGNGRTAYTDQTLARALREGVDPAGRRLDYLMPRYALDDADMAALIAHLRQLSNLAFPTADGAALNFATVVAPGVAPKRARAMTDVLRACFAEHNAGPLPTPGRQRLGAELVMEAPRPWQLHVWELAGAPASWAAQLAEHQRQTPVFALVGGIGGSDWRPVHDYCEGQGIPCLFPHLEVAVGEAGFYALYLSRGLLLEAALIARHLAEQAPPVRHVVQLLRDTDPSAQAAAAALGRSLAARGMSSETRAIGADQHEFAPLLETSTDDALVLWLRAGDLKRLAANPPAAEAIYLSASLGGREQAPLPAAWKTRALIATPYELPQNRGARQTQFRAWLNARGLAPADEIVQGDAYIACSALGIGMNAVANHLHRDYLVERLEVILGRGGLTGHYPRLSLGAGQRFASKAGYLVRFAAPESTHLVAVGERTAP